MRGSRGASLELRRWCSSRPLSSSRLATERFSKLASCGDVRESIVGISSIRSFWGRICVSEIPTRDLFWSRQPFVKMSAEAAVEDKPDVEVGSPEVEKLYQLLTGAVNQKRMPDASLLPSLLRHCATPADVKLAFDVIDKLRRLKAVQGQQLANYSSHMAQLMVQACIRSGDPQSGLKILLKKNQYGFSPSLQQAQPLLQYALVQKDTGFMLKILRTMVKNEVFPTQASAELIIRTCKDAGNIELLFLMAKELQVNGLSFKKPLYDVIITTAANIGDINKVHEVQQWREEQGLGHTTASAISLAKALVLEGKSQEAAKLISDHCTDTEKRDIYLSIMVKVWPLQVGAKVDEEGKEFFLKDLKEKVLAMSENLSEYGCNVPVDVNEEFAKGMSGQSRAQEEVVAATTPS